HLARVELDGVAVAGDRAGLGDAAAAAVARARATATVGLGAVMVGASQRLLDMALDHVRNRPQFGAPLGPLQAAKHTAADASVARARATATVALGAVMVGASQRLLDMALDHVRNGHQFGVPIGSFQAVKHMAVDVYVAVQRARALVQRATEALDEDDAAQRA